MKNKGFTLVELIAVISIIALIATLALKNISDKSKQFKDISNEKLNTLIESSAKSYLYNNITFRQDVKNNGNGCVSVATLKENKYIKEDLEFDFTKKSIKDKCVKITYEYDNNKYKFELSEECKNCNN